MKYVLDTHALVWFLEDNPKLSAKAKLELQSASNELFVPVIALAETCWMIENHKTSIPSAKEFFAAIDADPRIKVVPLTKSIVQICTTIPEVREMHDRQIVATALSFLQGGVTEMMIIAKDQNIAGSGLVPVLWS